MQKKEVRMKINKIKETNSIVLRSNEANDEKSGKEEVMEPLRSERVEDKVEKLLDDMLKFLSEMPIDRYHDYRAFRHTGLREYLIYRFMCERVKMRALKSENLNSNCLKLQNGGTGLC